MAHTYTNLLVHVVFSTKARRKLIPQEVQPDLWAYMGGIARTNHFKALAVAEPMTTPTSCLSCHLRSPSPKRCN